jgi:hypothetical protein
MYGYEESFDGGRPYGLYALEHIANYATEEAAEEGVLKVGQRAVIIGPNRIREASFNRAKETGLKRIRESLQRATTEQYPTRGPEWFEAQKEKMRREDPEAYTRTPLPRRTYAYGIGDESFGASTAIVPRLEEWKTRAQAGPNSPYRSLDTGKPIYTHEVWHRGRMHEYTIEPQRTYDESAQKYVPAGYHTYINLHSPQVRKIRQDGAAVASGYTMPVYPTPQQAAKAARLHANSAFGDESYAMIDDDLATEPRRASLAGPALLVAAGLGGLFWAMSKAR